MLRSQVRTWTFGGWWSILNTARWSQKPSLCQSLCQDLSFLKVFKRPCGISPRLIFFLSGCRPISGRDAGPPRTMNSTWAGDLYGYEYERMLIILHYCVSVNNYVTRRQFAINCGKILHDAIRLLHPSCGRLLGHGKEVPKPNGTWTEDLNVSSDISHRSLLRPYELPMFIVLLCTGVLAYLFLLIQRNSRRNIWNQVDTWYNYMNMIHEI